MKRLSSPSSIQRLAGAVILAVGLGVLFTACSNSGLTLAKQACTHINRSITLLLRLGPEGRSARCHPTEAERLRPAAQRSTPGRRGRLSRRTMAGPHDHRVREQPGAGDHAGNGPEGSMWRGGQFDLRPARGPATHESPLRADVSLTWGPGRAGIRGSVTFRWMRRPRRRSPAQSMTGWSRSWVW